MNIEYRMPLAWPLAAMMMLAVSRTTAWSEERDQSPSAYAEEVLDALLAAPPPKAPAWQAELNLRQGVGYTENVLYSPFSEQDSTFETSEMELLATRQSGSAQQLSLYAIGNHRRYFDLDDSNDEYNAFAQGEWECQMDNRGAGGLDVNYQFFDQFFDASVSETEANSTRLKQHDVGASTFGRYALLPHLTARIEGGYKVASVEQSSDDYRQWAASTSLEGQSPSGLTLAFTYGYTLDDYDDREERLGTGEVVPGETVAIAGHQFGVAGAWYWDTARNWRLRWRLTQRLRDDNGGDYYDYESRQGAIGLRGRMGRWRADVRADYTDTQYDQRRSDILDPASNPLQRQSSTLALRVERTLGSSWSLFSELTWEDHDANDPFDVYQRMMGTVGVGYNAIARETPES